MSRAELAATDPAAAAAAAAVAATAAVPAATAGAKVAGTAHSVRLPQQHPRRTLCSPCSRCPQRRRHNQTLGHRRHRCRPLDICTRCCKHIPVATAEDAAAGTAETAEMDRLAMWAAAVMVAAATVAATTARAAVARALQMISRRQLRVWQQ